jgi:hypothetical protein
MQGFFLQTGEWPFPRIWVNGRNFDICILQCSSLFVNVYNQHEITYPSCTKYFLYWTRYLWSNTISWYHSNQSPLQKQKSRWMKICLRVWVLSTVNLQEILNMFPSKMLILKISTKIQHYCLNFGISNSNCLNKKSKNNESCTIKW